MYVNAKKMAYLGLLLAFSIILIVLGSVFEFNTLLLLGLASFFVGVAIRECGHRLGTGFYIAAVILAFFLSPNKLYSFTYAGFGLYIVVTEFIWTLLQKRKPSNRLKILFYGIKFLLFNVMYIPVLYFAPSLVYNGELNQTVLVVLLIVGQVALVVFDWVYIRFQLFYGETIRKQIKLLD